MIGKIAAGFSSTDQTANILGTLATNTLEKDSAVKSQFKIAPSTIVLLFAVVVVSMSPKAHAIQESEPIVRPTLAAIASMLPEDAEDLNELKCFKSDGQPVDAATMRQFKLRLKVKDFQYPDHVHERPDGLAPIILVFSVDTRLIDSGVLPYLIIDGEELPARSYKLKDNEGFLNAIILPPKDLKEWPETSELRVRYADKNPQIVKEYSGPFTGKVDLVDGTYCQVTDRFGIPCFAFSRPYVEDPQPTRFLEPAIYFHDDSLLKVQTVNIEMVGDPMTSKNLVQVFEPCSADDIKKITVTEKTFIFEEFGEIRLQPKK